MNDCYIADTVLMKKDVQDMFSALKKLLISR